MELRKNRHAVYGLNYHIVLVTKYRHKCINEEIFAYLKDYMERIITDWNGILLEMNHDFDHIHMLVELPPQQAPSKAICSLKTVTSRGLRKEFPEYLNQFYWKDSFWSDSYLVISVGGATLDIVKQYIENQRKL